MARSARAFPVLGRALLVSALAGSACDGTLIDAEGVQSEDVSPASPEASSKIDPRVGLDRHAERSREVIVLLDDRSLRATFLSPIVAADPGRMDAMSAGLDLAKDRILARMTRHRLVALDRYSHLPALHLVLDSDEALTDL